MATEWIRRSAIWIRVRFRDRRRSVVALLALSLLLFVWLLTRGPPPALPLTPGLEGDWVPMSVFGARPSWYLQCSAGGVEAAYARHAEWADRWQNPAVQAHVTAVREAYRRNRAEAGIEPLAQLAQACTEPTSPDAPSATGDAAVPDVPFLRPRSSTATPLLPWMPLIQTPTLLDAHSSSWSFEWVSIRDGRVQFHNLSSDMRLAVQSGAVSGYKHILAHEQRYTEFASEVAEFLGPPLSLADCDEVVWESAFFAPIWFPWNHYHVHGDSLLPLWSQIRRAGLLSPLAPKRLYLFSADRIDMSRAVLFTHLYSYLFGVEQVRWFDQELCHHTQQARKRTCFRHVQWGRGPLLSYAHEAFPRPDQCRRLDDSDADTWAVLTGANRTEEVRHAVGREAQREMAGDAIAFQLHMLDLFQLTPRARPHRALNGDLIPLPLAPPAVSACESLRQRPTVVWLDRGRVGPRGVTNADRLAEIAREEFGVEWINCCEWPAAESSDAGPSIPAALRTLQRADILMGVHGAGLTNLLYMPPGGLLVELQDSAHTFNAFFHWLYRAADHAYVSIDMRAEGAGSVVDSDQPMTLSDAFIRQLLTHVLEEWRGSTLSCTPQQAEAARARARLPWIQRYPLSDSHGDRAARKHWSMQG